MFSLGWTEQLPDTPVDESTAVSENTEKTKKRYRKKKNKLEETFPAYLQVQLLSYIIRYIKLRFALVE